MVACWVVVQAFAVSQGEADKAVPGFLGLEEYVLQVLLDTFLPEAIESTNFGENIKPLMPIP